MYSSASASSSRPGQSRSAGKPAANATRREPATGNNSAGSGSAHSHQAGAARPSSNRQHSQPHLRNSPKQARPVNNGRGGRVKQFIDPARFISDAKIVEQEVYIPQNRFQDFKVHQKIIANVLEKGYVSPTPIQDQTIKLVLEGKDVVGIANTGTGKTAAFAIPLIHDLVTHMDNRLIIMAPTRELAQQIVEEMLSFSKGCGLKIALLIGGASMHLQKRDLHYSPRIVVGTPGRIKDHLSQGTLNLSGFNRVVLDEVDRMLDMGFVKDISSILSKVNPVRQSLFFSATMEPEISQLIEKFGRKPTTVSTRVGATVDSVSQNVIWYNGVTDKLEKLHNVLIGVGCDKTIIFDDTKRSVEKLGRELLERGFKVDRIHGDKSQSQRSRAIKRLKTDEINILVATDVAARGIDVSDITHVINFSQPNTYDDYIHRIGRTGRAGKTGQALTFLPK